MPERLQLFLQATPQPATSACHLSRCSFEACLLDLARGSLRAATTSRRCSRGWGRSLRPRGARCSSMPASLPERGERRSAAEHVQRRLAVVIPLRRSHSWQLAASLMSRAGQAACSRASRPAASTSPPAAWSSARKSRAAARLWSIATLCGFSRHVQSRMCVRVGRASSTWSVRRQEPPATGAQCAPSAGSHKSLCM